jgi:phage regulator Rha-like protein
MSSVEIADLCDKEHRNVLRNIRSILGEASIGALKFERTYLDAVAGALWLT